MGIGISELLLILVIAMLVFGTKKLKTIGEDLGGAIRGFKKAMQQDEDDKSVLPSQTHGIDQEPKTPNSNQ